MRRKEAILVCSVSSGPSVTPVLAPRSNALSQLRTAGWMEEHGLRFQPGGPLHLCVGCCLAAAHARLAVAGQARRSQESLAPVEDLLGATDGSGRVRPSPLSQVTGT